jgi:L-lactate utilization protein LutB
VGAGHPSGRTQKNPKEKKLADLIRETITKQRLTECLTNLYALADGIWVTRLAEQDLELQQIEELPKRKTPRSEQEKADFEKKLKKIEKLKEDAEKLGYFVMKKGTRIYVAKPDRQANQYIVDQSIGQPKQRQDITLDGDSGFNVTVYLPAKKPKDLQETKK